MISIQINKSATILFLDILLIVVCVIPLRLDAQIHPDLIESTIDFASEQMIITVSEMNNDPTLHPRKTNVSTGVWEFSARTKWTSGFFSGAAWFLYELTDNNSYWFDVASSWTEDLESQKYDTNSHDIGFQIFCSYGNAYKITQNDNYKNIIITAASSLATRYDENIGAIRSWSWGSWNYPVIIDNMMNLELLMWAAENGGDESLKTIAVNHAKKTLENHVREDGSTYHIIDYNDDGTIRAKDTHQGYNVESTWSRGQAWGLYGFIMMYRYTENDTFLTAAKNLSDYFIDNLPNDFVPYSDFEDPNIPNVSKDASAAAIACSALFEISEYVEDEKYKNAALDILNSLVTNYLSKNSNYQSVIKRGCTGSGNPERGLIYADYYFLEALLRYINNPLPVELSSFSAVFMNDGIKLNWRTETEVSNYGFEVQRAMSKVQSQDWETLGFVEGHGNSNSPKDYSFTDKNISGGKYSYRLKQIDTDGNFEYSKVIEVDLGSPTKFELSQNYPNPFNPSTKIRYSIPQSSSVVIKVFDILGNEIESLVNEEKQTGAYELTWYAEQLPSGIYFYRLQVYPANGGAGSFVETKKMLLMK